MILLHGDNGGSHLSALLQLPIPHVVTSISGFIIISSYHKTNNRNIVSICHNKISISNIGSILHSSLAFNRYDVNTELSSTRG